MGGGGVGIDKKEPQEKGKTETHTQEIRNETQSDATQNWV